MAIRKFSFSREWLDCCNLLLGIWLCLSPWVLRFSADREATEGAKRGTWSEMLDGAGR